MVHMTFITFMPSHFSSNDLSVYCTLFVGTISFLAQM